MSMVPLLAQFEIKLWMIFKVRNPDPTCIDASALVVCFGGSPHGAAAATADQQQLGCGVAMKGEEVRRGKEARRGDQICPECGYQYPVANPSPRFRRSHRKNCSKMLASKMPVVAEDAGVAVHKRRRGVAVENASRGGGAEEGHGCSSKQEEKAEPKLMANDPMLPHEKSMIRNGHYKLYPTKDAPQCNTLSFGPLFGLDSKAMIVTKGIKVTAGKTLDYKPEGGRSMLVFEAGVVDESHAITIGGSIYIYLTHKNETLCIGSISKAQPRARLWLILSEEMKLFHNSQKKTVYFNGYEFNHMYRSLLPLKTNKKLWG
ncbi:hypothetical protein E2562_023353, partial [Oryza meyeriana var. granulata]